MEGSMILDSLECVPAGDHVRESLNWYAVYVKSRHEFVVRDELRRKGINAFLPSFRSERRWTDRKKIVEFPLFPGYLFLEVAASPDAFLPVLKTHGVTAIISQEPGVPTPVAPEELHALRILVESGANMDVYPGLRSGMRVRVKNGPLKTAEGILDRKNDSCELLVNISLLGCTVSVKLFADDIEVL